MSTDPRVLAVVFAVGLGVAGVAAQVFPVRWYSDDDDERAALAVSTPAAAASMSALGLRPQDVAPVPCDAAHEGYVYVQKDVNRDQIDFSVALCLCSEENTSGLYKYRAWTSKFSTAQVVACSTLISP